MKRFLLAWMIIYACACAGYASDIPEGMKLLAELGLKNNLGLKIEKTQVLVQREQSTIEDAQFDSTLFAATGFTKNASPYESVSGFSDALTSDELAGQVGLKKRLLSGAELSAVISSQWISDNDLSNDLDNRYRTAFVVELTQPLLKGRGSEVNSSALQQSNNAARQRALAYLVQVQAYLLNLENSYWSCLFSKQLVSLRNEALDLAQSLVEANQKKFDAGQVAITEVQEAQTAAADRELSLSQAWQQFELQKQGVQRLVGTNLPERVFNPPVDYSDAEIDVTDSDLLEHLAETARSRRLEYQIAELDIENSRILLATRKNSLKPQLDLNLQAGLNGLAGDDRGYVSGSQYQGDYFDSIDSLSQGDGYQWQIGLNFSMPLERREAKARANQVRYQLRNYQYAMEDLDQQIRDEVNRQAILVARAKEQLDISRHFSDLAKTSLSQEERRLHEGLSNTFRMITFQERMVNAKIGHIQAVTAYHQALAGLSQTLGNTFSRYELIMVADPEEFSLEK